MNEALAERNFAAISQAINALNSKYEQSAERIQKLQEVVSVLTQQNQVLTQAVNGLRIIAMGRGPTA